jgi:hypothetical protein
VSGKSVGPSEQASTASAPGLDPRFLRYKGRFGAFGLDAAPAHKGGYTIISASGIPVWRDCSLHVLHAVISTLEFVEAERLARGGVR